MKKQLSELEQAYQHWVAADQALTNATTAYKNTVNYAEDLVKGEILKTAEKEFNNVCFELCLAYHNEQRRKQRR
jgi:hypothetical protein